VVKRRDRRSLESTLWDSFGTHVVYSQNENPRFPGVLGADDGTRTHDLLHGKEWRAFAPVRVSSPKPVIFRGLRLRQANASEPERTPSAATADIVIDATCGVQARPCGVKKLGSDFRLGSWLVRFVDAARLTIVGNCPRGPGLGLPGRWSGAGDGLTSGQNTELWASAGPRLAVRREHAIDAMDAGARSSSHRESALPRQRLAARQLAAGEKPTEARSQQPARGGRQLPPGKRPPHAVPPRSARTRRAQGRLPPHDAGRRRAFRTPGRVGTQTRWGRCAAAPAPGPSCATRSRSWWRSILIPSLSSSPWMRM